MTAGKDLSVILGRYPSTYFPKKNEMVLQTLKCQVRKYQGIILFANSMILLKVITVSASISEF